MFAAARKIRKPVEKLSEFEKTVATALLDLEKTASDLSIDLKYLYINSAREFPISDDKKAGVVFVPYPLLKNFQAECDVIVRNLEKKIPGHQITIIADRTIRPKPGRRNRSTSAIVPKSRTLTHVHSEMLDDICFPVHIIGKRTVYKTDGSRKLSVLLPKSKETEVSGRVFGFAKIYKKLTGKDTEFTYQ
eukprot:gnl/Dysnectes_brevis/55_a69_13545.p1 GENE.gnl/Dysnectes_brevis/55_a69_13545~~gnl/Dysnectes_brevis/55_a69_13545.p1  ORF type:complete len:216 (-),score=57.39 gnl/Dysnectes_brevis/55_a69_13545:93-662(-)